MTMLMWRSLPSATIVACLKSIVSRTGDTATGGAPTEKAQTAPLKRPQPAEPRVSAD
jgi:hypothetical protein